MKRVLILAAVAATALTAPAEALATNECDGLDVCISVPGPWVAVPGSPPAACAPSSSSCPALAGASPAGSTPCSSTAASRCGSSANSAVP